MNVSIVHLLATAAGQPRVLSSGAAVGGGFAASAPRPATDVADQSTDPAADNIAFVVPTATAGQTLATASSGRQTAGPAQPVGGTNGTFHSNGPVGSPSIPQMGPGSAGTNDGAEPPAAQSAPTAPTASIAQVPGDAIPPAALRSPDDNGPPTRPPAQSSAAPDAAERIAPSGSAPAAEIRQGESAARPAPPPTAPAAPAVQSGDRAAMVSEVAAAPQLGGNTVQGTPGQVDGRGHVSPALSENGIGAAQASQSRLGATAPVIEASARRSEPSGTVFVARSATAQPGAGDTPSVLNMARDAVDRSMPAGQPERPAATPSVSVKMELADVRMPVPDATLPPSVTDAPELFRGTPDIASRFGGEPLFVSTDGASNVSMSERSSATAAQTVRLAGSFTPAVEQVAVRVQRAIADGAERIAIQLRPAALGQVDINLEVTHDGRVAAVVMADKADTLEMLQRDARQLERALADAGLRADSGSLSFNLRQGGSGGAQNNAAESGAVSPGDADTAAGATAYDNADSYRTARPGGVDLLI